MRKLLVVSFVLAVGILYATLVPSRSFMRAAAMTTGEARARTTRATSIPASQKFEPKKPWLHCSDTPCSGCSDDEYSAGVERIGVLRSTDEGVTWTFLGHACFHAPTLVPVDPSALTVDGGVALYFLDLASLRSTAPARVVYRAVTGNGLTFTTPEPAFTIPDFVTDPFVLRLFNGSYLMYLHDSASIRISQSNDGLVFPAPGTVIPGALPGALQLAGGAVRLFDCEPDGIVSSTSPDGIGNFVRDLTVPSIPTGGATLVCDPHPIALRKGGFLMAYKVIPAGGQTPLDDQIYLATSTDALRWTVRTPSVGIGGVPSIVELADGTLLLYFVNFHY